MNVPGFLSGLATDVLEHGACDGCKVNAAMGLEELGLLEGFLERTGLLDPRPPSDAPWAPEHVSAPVSPERDTTEQWTLSMTFRLPSEATRDSARRRLDTILDEVRRVAIGEGAAVQGSKLEGQRPRS